jgi:hypothetical protein
LRFVDFLKATVLLSAGAATALALIAVLSASAHSTGDAFIAFIAGWWVLAAAGGLWLGRRAAVSGQIARLLAGAKLTSVLPEYRPAFILFNRLWPLFVFSVLAGALGFLAPQIPGIGAGFAIAWSLAWRRQHAAVLAIEERDGICFHVKRTSPTKPMELQRTPGFKALRPEQIAA